MNKFDLFSPSTPQRMLGVVRPRLYTLDEAAEELSIPKKSLAYICSKSNVRPKFNQRPHQYALNDLKEAVNKRKGAPLFEIEKAVPLPPVRPPTIATEMLKTLLEMEEGDSFLANQNQLVILYRVAKENNIAIATRKTDNPDQRRVWKVAK